jgi:UDP-glucuronate 4-epimerase
MEKILLTGCAGFIGAKTTEKLIKQGYTVIGIDNMNDYYDIQLKEYRLSQLSKLAGFRFHKVDIENKEDLENIFENNDFSAIFNLAARAGVSYSMKNPDIYMTTNALGTLNIMNMMKKYEVKKMILASTSSLYAGQLMPFVETLAVNTPISPYAASKKSAEVMAYTYSYLYDLDISVVRYFTVYGPAGRPDMSIFRFIKWIDEGQPIELFGDGTQARDFTYVDDIVAGTIKAIKPVNYEVINLGGGNNPVSLNSVISLIENLTNKKARYSKELPFHKTDIKATWANIEKAKKILNWEPQISLEEGLSKTVKWYYDNIELLKKIKM